MQRRSELKRCLSCSILMVWFCGASHIALAAQIKFTDDANRTAVVPSDVSRVFAAGAPAELLLYTLAPEKLVGRNHMPSAAALEFTPEALQHPIQIMQLPHSFDAAADQELLALKPDIYVDYGDVTEDYVTSLNNVQNRTHLPAIIMDGALKNIPSVYRKLGKLFNEEQRGKALAKHADRILTQYRQSLSKRPAPPRVYLACSFDAAVPCLKGERNGELLDWLGAINVAGDIATAATRPVNVEDMKSWNPDVLIVASDQVAAKLLSDPAWQDIKAIRERRLYVPPAVPFSWGPRPPSVNRLMGLIWLAYVLPGKSFDADFYREMREFFADFYHFIPSEQQMRRLVEVSRVKAP